MKQRFPADQEPIGETVTVAPVPAMPTGTQTVEPALHTNSLNGWGQVTVGGELMFTLNVRSQVSLPQLVDAITRMLYVPVVAALKQS